MTTVAEAGQGFEIDFDAIDRFQKSMEAILKDLLAGNGSLTQSAQLHAGVTDLGERFDEAPWMHGVLMDSSNRLQQLIKNLQDQVAVMKLSVKMAAGNVDAVDEDARRALTETLKRIEESSKPGTVPPPAAAAPSGNTTGVQ